MDEWYNIVNDGTFDIATSNRTLPINIYDIRMNALERATANSTHVLA